MKKLKLLAVAFLTMFFVNANVYAECREVATGEEVAKVEGGKYCDTLDEAFTSVSEKGTVKLLKDITEASKPYIFIGTTGDGRVTPKEMTIDFDTHTLTINGSATKFGILVYGTATLKNGNIISNVTESGGSKASAIVLGNTAKLTLENMKIESTTGYGINAQAGTTSLTLDKDSEVKASVAATIIGHGASAHHTFNISGKVTNTQTYSALEGQYQAGDVNINIYEGADVVSSMGAGILHMCPGNVLVDNGSVTGNTAIIMTKGNLDVTGGTIRGTGDYQEFKASANYQVFDNGAAIYIEPADTINTNITGGTLQSEKSYALSAPVAADTNKDKLTLSISDGNFQGNLGSIELTGLTKFVTSGMFSDTINPEFISDGSAESESGRVGIVYKIEIDDYKNGTVKSQYNDAVKNEIINVDITPDKDFKKGKIKVVDADGKEIQYEETDTGIKFKMPESDVKISVEFTKVEQEIMPPQTLDNIFLFVSLGIVSIIAIILVVRKMKAN